MSYLPYVDIIINILISFIYINHGNQAVVQRRSEWWMKTFWNNETVEQVAVEYEFSSRGILQKCRSTKPARFFHKNHFQS